MPDLVEFSIVPVLRKNLPDYLYFRKGFTNCGSFLLNLLTNQLKFYV